MLEIAKNIYFPVRVKGRELKLIPAKIKFADKITGAVRLIKADSPKTFADVVSIILSENKEGIRYSTDWVVKNVTTEEAFTLITEYAKWLQSLSNLPN